MNTTRGEGAPPLVGMSMQRNTMRILVLLATLIVAALLLLSLPHKVIFPRGRISSC